MFVDPVLYLLLVKSSVCTGEVRCWSFRTLQEYLFRCNLVSGFFPFSCHSVHPSFSFSHKVRRAFCSRLLFTYLPSSRYGSFVDTDVVSSTYVSIYLPSCLPFLLPLYSSPYLSENLPSSPPSLMSTSLVTCLSILYYSLLSIRCLL